MTSNPVVVVVEEANEYGSLTQRLPKLTPEKAI